MAEFNRREALEMGATVLGAGVIGDYLTPDGFEKVIRKIDHRTNYIRENPGATIHFDDPNKALDKITVGFVGGHYSDMEGYLAEKSPEEIANELPRGADLQKTRRGHDLIMEEEANMKIVYMDEGNMDADLQGHVEVTESAFNELLPDNFDVNVDSQRVEPGEEDLKRLERPEKDFGGLKLSDKYSERGESAVFLTERNVKDGFRGHADYSQNISYVELSGEQGFDQYVTVHELGHHRLRLPHNFMHKGVMSYNDEAKGDTSFNEASQRIVNALVGGEVDYNVRMVEVNEVGGEAMTREAPLIDIEAEPAQIDNDFAERYVKENVDAFVNQYIDAEADRVSIGLEETEVLYSKGGNELTVILDGDVKGAEVR